MMQRKTSKITVPDLPTVPPSGFYQAIVDVLNNARVNSHRAVNFIMVEAYWNVGRMIVEEEQQGRVRAEYGMYLIRNLAIKLTDELGKGFDERELRRMRQFYSTYPIRGAVRPELRWSHYRLLLRIENEKARAWHLAEAADQNWSIRTLDHQINARKYQKHIIHATTRRRDENLNAVFKGM